MPFAPGGPVDVVGRNLIQRLNVSMGQPFVLDNRGGNGSTLGAELVAKSPADGYTWLLNTGSQTSIAAFNENVPFDAIRDFSPVTMAARNFGQVLIVHPSVPAKTVKELIDAFSKAREDEEIGVVILAGEGGRAFCSGGDQRVRGDQGYVGNDGVPRLNVLDLQKLIRSIPKPVVAMVAGWAIGGGHVLHVVCDLTIAADNARFGQTGPRVGSFDGGFGAAYLARLVGQKKAREIWYLCRQYDAQEAREMGLVNTVVPLADLEATTVQWCREMLANSPTALRACKAALNADCDGQAGLQELAGII